LGDWADPANLLAGILQDLSAKRATRLVVGEGTDPQTIMHLQSILPEASLVLASEYLKPARMIKSADEIAHIRRAGEITEAAYEDVIRMLKPGISELEVIAEVDYRLRLHGSQGSSFNTTLYAVGPEHELIFGDPQRSWPRRLDPPVALLFDFGAIYEGYCYDFGRTVSFGEISPDLQGAYDLVKESQAAGIAAMRVGSATTAQVDQAARQVIEDAGLGEAFRHRLGHGIGLDVHEPPYLTRGDDTVLETGMLFTVEPSILIPYGGSARVEDVVLVGKEGGIPLTSGFQKLLVIE
jgi:Xaa-Pro aminopeptidase